MIIYREIIAGARQPNVLQMTAVVTENVTSGVTLLVTGGVTLLVTYGVTFSDTMKPGSTNCNSNSCERDHLDGVTGNQGDRFLILLAIYGQPGIKNIMSCFLQTNGFTPFNKITSEENVSKTPSP